MKYPEFQFTLIIFIWLILFFQISSWAQGIFNITQIENPIKLDGKMESEWNRSDSISAFIQLEPLRGILSTRRTVV